MKMRSLAMVIISGALLASSAFLAPAMADDLDNGDPMMSLAENDTTNGNDTNIGNDTSNNENGNTNNGNDNGNDAGAPDTATGDDDY